MNLSIEYVSAIHSFIKQSINSIGFKATIDNLFFKILPNIRRSTKKANYKKLNYLYNKMSDLIFTGDIVGSCLTLSLTFHLLLSINMNLSKLQIGVRVIDGKLYSHAWVIYDDRIIGKQYGNIDYIVIKEIQLGNDFL